MIEPGIPADEPARLDALRRLEILDTPPEERFDRITRVAARLFNVPIAAISLIDQDRQWFKSRHGLEAAETPRAVSFCGHTILQEDVLHVADATQDPRFAGNPLVTGEPHIRFYAGMPLRSPDGKALGTLCLIDTKAREFSNSDRRVLDDLAAWAAQALATRNTSAAKSAERGWWLGVLITALTVGLFELLSTRLFYIPNPPAFLLVAVVFAAFHGGLRAGLISSAISWLYFAHFFSLPGQPFHFSDDNLARVLVWAVATPAIAVMTGLLHRRSERNFAHERDYQIMNAQMTERAAALDGLRDAHEQLHLVTENTPLSIVYYDAQLRCQYCNGAYAKRFGLVPGQLIGKHLSEIIDGELFQKEMPELQRVLSGETVKYSRARLGADGGTTLEELAMIPRLAERGAVVGWYGFVTDVTDLMRNRDELRRAKERLDSALENSEIAVWSTDLRNNEIWISEGWAAYLGKPRAETYTTAAELLEIAHPEDRQALKAVAVQLMKNEISAYAIEHRVKSEGGQWKWILSRGRVVDREPGGQALRVSGTNVDITERRKAEEARARSDARFRAVFERSQAGITIWGIDGRYLAANNAFCEFVGYAADELIGKMYGRDFLLPDDAEGTEISARLRRGDIAFSSRDRGYRRRDGNPVWGRTTVSAVKEDGALQYFVAVVIDITETRAAHAHIERINAELEERIIERTAELRAALKELDSFSYSVSHDLRAPAGAVSGFAHLLRTNEAAQLSDDAKHLLEMIEKNSERMINLIEGLLKLSHLGHGQIRRVALSMDEMVRDVLRDFAAADRAGIRVRELPGCQGDPVLLRQVWANLIGNALKYSRTREPARVEVGWDEGSRAYFVRDNGVGFDMQFYGKLFGPFERLHGDSEFEGNGIGLAIVQRIVQRHGGKIWADAVIDHGATFSFTVPALPGSGAPPTAVNGQSA